MANPQPTDAHLRVAHTINEAIMTRDFTKRQRKILDLVLRLSWGCGRKDAYIPHQRDFSVVGIHEVDVKSELDWLAVSKVIGRSESFYWFNKDFDTWEVSRVKPYQPKKLSELLSLNLNGNRPELSETLRQNLVKHEVTTKQNTKFPTPESVSPKERLKKVLKKDIYISLFNLWNEQEIIVHQTLTDDMKRAIDKALKDFSLNEVSQAIKNYAEILKGDQYYFKYSWPLKDFLKRGLEKFALDIVIIRRNYLQDKGGQSGTHRQSSRKLPKNYRTPEQIFGDQHG